MSVKMAARLLARYGEVDFKEQEADILDRGYGYRDAIRPEGEVGPDSVMKSISKLKRYL